MSPSLFISPDERRIAEAMARLGVCNPFLAERVELERAILGESFEPFFVVWHPRADVDDHNPNVVEIARRTVSMVERLRERLVAGAEPDASERALYRDLCLYTLYYRHQLDFREMVRTSREHGGGRDAPFYAQFVREHERLLDLPHIRDAPKMDAPHVFAGFFQLRRAFHFVFRAIAGSSMPIARFRARIWQSIFTHDLHRYQRLLYDRMGEVTTLITGPSGAGKELVARALGHARYIPFDPSTKRFRESFEEGFFPLNLPALSPTLIESELFGHKKGAFTGADADRKGWLEVCPPFGTVFLDEIGEIDPGIQVKLLRVLETRTFQPLGSTETLPFRGKIVAATNRDLEREMRAGRFRRDLYFRLCADTIDAPSLRERIADSPEELATLLEILAERLVGTDDAPTLAREAAAWIDEHLGSDYAWPGNVRELSQCLSNLLIHRDYRPLSADEDDGPRDRFAADVARGALSADELMRAYCALVYEQAGSYSEAARRLELDRRTVRRHVEAARRDR